MSSAGSLNGSGIVHLLLGESAVDLAIRPGHYSFRGNRVWYPNIRPTPREIVYCCTQVRRNGVPTGLCGGEERVLQLRHAEFCGHAPVHSLLRLGNRPGTGYTGSPSVSRSNTAIRIHPDGIFRAESLPHEIHRLTVHCETSINRAACSVEM